MGQKGRRSYSQQERWVIRHEEDLTKEKQFMEILGSIELTWVEGFILLQHIYRGLPLDDLADTLGVTVPEAEAAKDTLVKKTAVALGYVTAQEAGVTVKLVEDEIVTRRRKVKELYESGLTMAEISRRLKMAESSVRYDLQVQGLR